jgi:hypothetical protein
MGNQPRLDKANDDVEEDTEDQQQFPSMYQGILARRHEPLIK